MMKTCIEMCPDCPLLPPGVTKAAVLAIEPPDIHRMLGFALFHEVRGVAEDAERDIRIRVEALDVDGSTEIEEGDEAYLHADGKYSSEEDVARSFEHCPGPKQNRIQKALGITATCQAIN